MSAQQTDRRSTLLKVIQRVGGVLGVTPHEDIRTYRDILLGLVCGVALILGTGAFLEQSSIQRKLIPLGVILLCLLLAPGRRLLVLAGGCFIVVIRGAVAFVFTGEPIALVLTLVYGLAIFLLLRLGARLEEQDGTSSAQQPPDHPHSS